MRYLILFIAFLAFAQTSRAAEPVPGGSCSTAGATMASNNSGIGHFMICQGGTWKAVYSYNAAGGLTKIGNLSCASGEILKWNGSVWACAADDGADNLGNHTATATLNMNSQAISGAATISATGKISTTGIVKVGTQAACAAADAGSMRYAGGSAPWEYCDGGGTWRPFRQPRCQNDDAGECYLASPRSGDDPDFTAANIRCGVNILGVIGTSGGTPAPLNFFDLVGGSRRHVAPNTLVTSNTVTITGMDPACGAVPVTVSGTPTANPQISIDGGSWTTSGMIANNQTLTVRMTSASKSVTAYAYVSVGSVSDQWAVTTWSRSTFTFVATSSGATSTVSIPGTPTAGDLCIIWGNAWVSGSTAPTDSTPAGFTKLATNTWSTGGGIARQSVYAKILTGSETTVTGLNGVWMAVTLRPDVPVTSFANGMTPNFTSSDSNPAPQTITAAITSGSASALLPVVLWGQMGSSGAINPRITSPAMDEVSSDGKHYAHYKIYSLGDAPADHSYDMDDEGNGNALQSGYLVFGE